MESCKSQINIWQNRLALNPFHPGKSWDNDVTSSGDVSLPRHWRQRGHLVSLTPGLFMLTGSAGSWARCAFPRCWMQPLSHIFLAHVVNSPYPSFRDNWGIAAENHAREKERVISTPLFLPGDGAFLGRKSASVLSRTVSKKGFLGMVGR